MSFEQSLTRRTVLCSDAYCNIVKEEPVFLTCGGDRFLTDAFTSRGCRFVYHDDFLDLLDSVRTEAQKLQLLGSSLQCSYAEDFCGIPFYVTDKGKEVLKKFIGDFEEKEIPT